jgi:hypothetical protein
VKAAPGSKKRKISPSSQKPNDVRQKSVQTQKSQQTQQTQQTMKKNILIAAIAAIGISSASAQEAVYLTGATAFRSAVNATLFANYAANLVAASSSEAARNDSSFLKFTNITVGGSQVDLYVAWTGSEAGIRSVASPSSNPVTATYYATSVTKTNTGYGRSVTGITENKKGQIAFSDTWQEVSNFQGRGKDGRTYSTLNRVAVGVVPFSFFVNKGAPISNVNIQNFTQIAGSGEARLNLFTGNQADTNSKVWLTGRDPFSGSRVVTLVIGKHGYNTPVVQYMATNIAGGTIGRLTRFASNNSSGLIVTAANNGESSGGTLTSVLTNSTAITNVPVGLSRGTNNYILSYVSVGDAYTKILDGCTPVDFCGVNGRWGRTNEIIAAGNNIAALDSGYTNIITGRYPFWSYEHILWPQTGVTAAQSNVISFLTNQIAGYDTTNPLLGGNIALKDMRVRRSSDGANQDLN